MRVCIRWCVCLLFCFSAGWVRAAEWPLLPDQRLVGQLQQVEIKTGDSLVSLGRRFGVGYDNMLRANPGVDIWLPPLGAQVVVPQRYLLPDGPRRGVVLNLAEKRLFYYPKHRSEVWVFAVGIGRADWPTPLGNSVIVAKRQAPDWFPPASIRLEAEQAGRILPVMVPAGDENPLGSHALYLSRAGYLLHGTHRPAGVGMEVSHGCIRLYPADIARLYQTVAIGEPVRIIDEPYKLGWQDGALWLEVHPPAYRPARQDVPQALIDAIIAVTPEGVPLMWAAVREAVRRADGVPVRIGQRPLP